MSKLKVFFSCSTTSFFEMATNYKAIIDSIEAAGFEVTSNISMDEFSYPSPSKDYSHYSNSSTYGSTMKKILDSQIVVIDASVHSMTLGVLLAHAKASRKPCLLLTRERPDDEQDMFASGGVDTNFLYEIYNTEKIDKIIKSFLRKYTRKRTSRVNFVLDSDTNSRLEWLAFRMHTSKTEVVRRAIERLSPED